MTAFGQDAGPCVVRPAPVTPHIRVGEVPPADRLELIHTDNLAQPTASHDLPHLVGVSGVAHHVADREYDPGFLDCVDHLDAARSGWCDRLFQQHVVAQLRETACRADVLVVRRGDDHRIRERRQCGKLPPVVEPPVGRHAEPVGQRLAASGAGIGDGHHTSPLRISLREAGERATPRTGTSQRDRDRPFTRLLVSSPNPNPEGQTSPFRASGHSVGSCGPSPSFS